MVSLQFSKTLFRMVCVSALLSASVTLLHADTYHMLSPTVGATTPSGQTLQTASTSNSGFTPTVILSATPLYWYGPVLTGSYAAGSWSLLTWTEDTCASEVRHSPRSATAIPTAAISSAWACRPWT